MRTGAGVQKEVRGGMQDGVRGSIRVGSPLVVADGGVLLQRGAKRGNLLGQRLQLPCPLPGPEGAVEVVGAVGGVQGEHLQGHQCQRCPRRAPASTGLQHPPGGGDGGIPQHPCPPPRGRTTPGLRYLPPAAAPVDAAPGAPVPPRWLLSSDALAPCLVSEPVSEGTWVAG